tara:strand:+ start:673 stop:894 length:222 start_codon:yes stop_codon:yes gene_type:complete
MEKEKKIVQPKRGGRPVRHSAGMTIQEKHMNYMRGLSRVVGEACDRYFERKGMPTALSWSAKAKQEREKRKQK